MKGILRIHTAHKEESSRITYLALPKGWHALKVKIVIPRGLCICRSRDVAVVKVTMNFEPNKVNIQKKNCRVEGKETVCINATVCFNVKLKSKENVVYEAGKCHDTEVLWSRRTVYSICSHRMNPVRWCISLDDRNLTSHCLCEHTEP